MDARKDSEPTKNRTTVEPKSEREIVVTRTFDAPARIVFQAWTTPALGGPGQTMKAFIIDGCGSADRVRAGDVSDPELRENDVLACRQSVC